MQKYEVDQLDAVGLRAAAAERGCVVLVPNGNELLLDLDSDEAAQTLRERLEWFSRNFPGHLELVWVRPSASGLPHRHAAVRYSRNVTPQERVALQALLGSDPVRELLAWVRAECELDRPPHALFVPPDFAPPGAPEGGSLD